MRRKITIGILAGVAVTVAVAVALPHVRFCLLTGRFFPIERIDTLSAPVGVKGWDADGLILANGRRVPLPGVRKLLRQSAALTEVTKRGVEIGADGRVYGLVQVHHWCGNDPVRKDIARVDVADMMMFLRVGEPVGRVPNAEFLVREAGGTFSEWGWWMSEFTEFESWQGMKDRAR